eukprot:scaffold70754_cov23-Tisochrysis_lutea.AAC.1
MHTVCRRQTAFDSVGLNQSDQQMLRHSSHGYPAVLLLGCTLRGHVIAKAKHECATHSAQRQLIEAHLPGS